MQLKAMELNKGIKNCLISWGLAFGLASFLCWNQAGGQDVPVASEVYAKALKQYQKGNWDGAKEYLHQYLAEYSDSPLYITSLYYLGVCYEKLNNIREAMSIFHKVIDEAREGEDAFWAQMSEKRIEQLNEMKQIDYEGS